MGNDDLGASWLHFKAKVKEEWHKLTDDDLDEIDGKREHMLGKLQERHGLTEEEAEQQLSDWHRRNPTNFFERY